MAGRWVGNAAGLNRSLREAAARGHGVLTRGDLGALGVTPSMLHARKRAGTLVPVLRGVVTLPGTQLTDRGRWRSAVYAGGPQCCLHGRSALALHGLVRERDPIRIVRRSGAGRTPESRIKTSERFGFTVHCHQARVLPEDEITAVDGIRTTRVERALLDFAAEATAPEIAKALTQAERERNLCWATLERLIASTGGRKGLARLRKELELWLPAFVEARSEPEEDFLGLIRRHGLPIPVVNEPRGGYVPDFLWKELGLVVELDPYGTHKGYASFHNDRRKSIALERSGLRVIRFTWNDLYNHPDRTAAELGGICEQQARVRGGRTAGSPPA